ncbi:MAG: FitA-like ribbon-helix-helix domain-containing protein [Burkholderiales bacterium]
MAVLTIRNIDDSVKSELRVQAARNGRSMEEEARHIIAEALNGARPKVSLVPLGTRLRQRFAGVGDINIPPRRPARKAPNFSANAEKPK